MASFIEIEFLVLGEQELTELLDYRILEKKFMLFLSSSGNSFIVSLLYHFSGSRKICILISLFVDVTINIKKTCETQENKSTLKTSKTLNTSDNW